MYVVEGEREGGWGAQKVLGSRNTKLNEGLFKLEKVVPVGSWGAFCKYNLSAEWNKKYIKEKTNWWLLENTSALCSWVFRNQLIVHFLEKKLCLKKDARHPYVSLDFQHKWILRIWKHLSNGQTGKRKSENCNNLGQWVRIIPHQPSR